MAEPKTCPGCGGEMRDNETAYPCGRKPVRGSLETTQCVRHQLFDAREQLGEIRAVADRLADACVSVITISDRKHDAWDELKAALADYRKATT